MDLFKKINSTRVKKYSIRLVKVLLSILAVGTIAIIGIVTLVDPNQLKDTIAKELSLQTGRQIILQGPIYWRLEPQFVLEIHDLILKEPLPQVSSSELRAQNEILSIKKATFRFHPTSVFSGKGFLDTHLEGVTFVLHRDSANHANWSELSKHLSENFEARKLFWSPDKLKIDKATLVWQDDQNQQKYLFKNLSFVIDNLASSFMTNANFWDQPAPFKLTCQFEDQLQPRKADIVLEAALQFNQSLKKLDIQNIDIQIALKEEVSGKGGINPTINSAAPVSTSPIISASPFSKLVGNISIIDVQGNLCYLGKIEATNLICETWTGFFKLPKPILPAKSINIKTHFKYQFPNFESESFTLTLDNNNTLEGHFKAELKTKSLQNVNAKGLVYGKDLQLGNTFVNKLNASFELKEGLVTFSPFKINVANSNHQGTLEVDFRGHTPHYVLNDQMDSFDINDSLALFELKDWMNGRGLLKVELNTQGENISDVLQNLSGKAHIIVTDGKLHGIELPTLLQHMQSTVAELSDTLVKQQPVNVAAILTAELSEWKQQAVNIKRLSTPFKYAEVQAKIDHGKLQFSNLKLTHQEYTIQGKGTLDLVNKKMEYQGAALLNRTVDNPPKEIANFLKDAPLNIQVKGPLNNLSVRPDLAGYAQGALKSAHKENEAIKPPEFPSEKQTNKLLEELFGLP